MARCELVLIARVEMLKWHYIWIIDGVKGPHPCLGMVAPV